MHVKLSQLELKYFEFVSELYKSLVSIHYCFIFMNTLVFLFSYVYLYNINKEYRKTNRRKLVLK